jgi:undecaprenyl diphosphate synthase
MTVLQRIRLGRRLRARAQEPRLPRTAATVAIIMDGNGRWASRRGLAIGAGHRAGTAALHRTVEAAPDFGIRTLCVYAFSTENWTRPDAEVADLMDLFADTIRDEFPHLDRKGVRIRFVGRRDRVSDTVRALMADIEGRTAQNQRLDLYVAFDYGGRAEIVDACRQIVSEGLAPAEITADTIRARLARPELPDPDLVIRTSGEMRLSNFLLWQSAYSELVFSPVLWPDFGEEPLRAALAEYASRRRRFGGR